MAPTSQTEFIAALDKRVAQCWCLEPWTDPTHLPVQMDCCKQLMGTKCIKQWVNSNAVNNNKCPHCRQELFRKEGSPSSSLRQAPMATTPLIWAEPRSQVSFFHTSSVNPLPINHQPASAATRPPLPPLGFASTSIVGAVPSLLPAARNISHRVEAPYRAEARYLWTTILDLKNMFQRLWAKIHAKPGGPLAAATKWNYMVALLRNEVRQEQTQAARGGNTPHAHALLGYLYHLDRLPTNNVAHTEEQTRAVVASGPLFDCVDFMLMVFNLVYRMQPTYATAETLVMVMNYVYYGRVDSDPSSDWRSWEYIFGDAVSMRRCNTDVPALRILTVLLMCHSLPAVKQAFGTGTSRFEQYDRRCVDVVSILRIRLSLMPRDRLLDLAQMSDRELLSSWYVV